MTNPLNKIESADLQAQFTPEERDYFDKLKAELLVLFYERDYEAIVASDDLETMKKIRQQLDKIIQFIIDKKIPEVDIEDVRPWTPEQVIGWLTPLCGLSVAREEVLTRYSFENDYVEYGGNFSQGLGSLNIDTMPECFWVHGNLSINQSGRLRFPRIVIVDNDCFIAAQDNLPESLAVGRNLLIQNCNIKKLPKSLAVNGQELKLENCTIENLPDNFCFSGFLTLEACPNLKKLPRGMKVKRLSLLRSPIESLPDDLFVAEELWLSKDATKLIEKAQQLKDKGLIHSIHIL